MAEPRSTSVLSHRRMPGKDPVFSPEPLSTGIREGQCYDERTSQKRKKAEKELSFLEQSQTLSLCSPRAFSPFLPAHEKNTGAHYPFSAEEQDGDPGISRDALALLFTGTRSVHQDPHLKSDSATQADNRTKASPPHARHHCQGRKRRVQFRAQPVPRAIMLTGLRGYLL